MVKFVENELLNIKTEVNDMWQLVYQQLDNAYKSVLNVDMELADKVILREKRVNAFELRIDSDIEDFIALYNPVAVDLRFALAMLKINTNLERIGDYADSIARFVIRTELKPENKALFAELQLEDMFHQPCQIYFRQRRNTGHPEQECHRNLGNIRSRTSRGNQVVPGDSGHLPQTGTCGRPHQQPRRRNRVLHRCRSVETPQVDDGGGRRSK